MGVFACIYAVAWYRSVGSPHIRELDWRTMAPSGAYLATMLTILLEVFLLMLIVAIPLALWEFVIVKDVPRQIGWESLNTGAVSVAFTAIFRADVIRALAYAHLATFVVGYFSMLALHLRRAPLSHYDAMVESLFRLNLIITLGTLFAMVLSGS